MELVPDKPMGGTQLQYEWLVSSLPQYILSEVQFICDNTKLEMHKKRVLWLHGMPADTPFIVNAVSRRQFDKIVFVSSWQQTIFKLNADVPYSEGVVIKNAVEPITNAWNKSNDKIRIIYHPVPNRGLEILVPTFVRIAKKNPDIHLDVFSNFDIYARSDLNKTFEKLYDICRNHPQITYHGYQPNAVIREYLEKAHIFAYPCIWLETSCISAMEAMTARCLIVAPEYGALGETLSNFNIDYPWTENIDDHQRRFETAILNAIEIVNLAQTSDLLDLQKKYCDTFYNKKNRLNEWIKFLEKL